MTDEFKVFILYAIVLTAWVPSIILSGILVFAQAEEGVYHFTNAGFIGYTVYIISMAFAISEWAKRVVCKMYPRVVQCGDGSSKKSK